MSKPLKLEPFADRRGPYVRAWSKTIGRYVLALDVRGADDFSVCYGLQVKHGLSYSEAATELGACLMHALACEGKLCD